MNTSLLDIDTFADPEIESLIDEITQRPAQKDPHQIGNRWNNWQKRLQVYAGLPSYELLETWQKSPKFLYQRKKLLDALIAFKELQNNIDTNSINQNKANDIEKVLLQMIDIELTKLEINQLRTLAKIQDSDRNEIQNMRQALNTKKQITTDEIKKSHFSPQFSVTTQPQLKKYFKRQEKKISLTPHIHRSEKTADALSVAGPTAVATSASNVGQVLGNVLSAIPLVSAVAAGVPIVLKSIKTWTQNKSKEKKVGALIGAAVVVGAILAAGFIVVATAAIAAGLITIGVIQEHIYPWIKLRNKIQRKNKEIIDIQERQMDLIHNVQAQSLRSLQEREKQFLLKKIEDAWISNPFIRKQDRDALIEAKQLVTTGNDLTKLMENKFIQTIVKVDEKTADKKAALTTFLVEQNKARIHHLQNEIGILQKKEEEKRGMMVSGLLTIVGAVLICIPTPITIIAGASLLAVGAVGGIAVKYHWGDRIKNFFTKKSAPVPTPSTVTPSSTTPTPQEKFTQEKVMHPHTSTAKLEEAFGVTNEKIYEATKVTSPTPQKASDTTVSPANQPVPAHKNEGEEEGEKGEEGEHPHWHN